MLLFCFYNGTPLGLGLGLFDVENVVVFYYLTSKRVMEVLMLLLYAVFILLFNVSEGNGSNYLGIYSLRLYFIYSSIDFFIYLWVFQMWGRASACACEPCLHLAPVLINLQVGVAISTTRSILSLLSLLALYSLSPLPFFSSYVIFILLVLLIFSCHNFLFSFLSLFSLYHYFLFSSIPLLSCNFFFSHLSFFFFHAFPKK